MKSPAGKVAQTNGQTPRAQKRKSNVLNTPTQKLKTPAKTAITPAKPKNTPANKGAKGMTPAQKKKAMTPKKSNITEEEEEEDEEEVPEQAVEEEESEEEEPDLENEEEGDDDEKEEEEEGDADGNEETKMDLASKKPKIMDMDHVIMIKNCLAITPRFHLSKRFSNYGTIDTMWVKFDSMLAPKTKFSDEKKTNGRPQTTRSRTCKFFIRYTNREDAEKAVQAENGTMFHGRHLSVELAQNNRKMESSYDSNKTIYVGNVASVIEEEDLWSFFGACGKVVNVRLLRNFTNKYLMQYAFVTFNDKKGFESALNLSEPVLGGSILKIMKHGAEHKVPFVSKDLSQKNNNTNKGKNQTKPIKQTQKAKAK